MNPIIGLDLGGTKVALATLCERELSEFVVEPTDLAGSEALIEQLVRMVEAARPELLDGVGVGVSSVVEFDEGRVLSSTNVPLAELVARDLVILTVGTGVGGGLILGGRIYRGATEGAGELGHTIVGLDIGSRVPPPVDFPQPGSLECAAAGQALDRAVGEVAEAAPQSVLGRVHAEGQPILGADAVQAAHDGDAAAARMVEIWGERVGIGVANAINTFDPEEVVIGGGAARAGELLLEPARRVARDYVLRGLGKRTTIRLARHGVRAGVLGAALLAVHELAGA